MRAGRRLSRRARSLVEEEACPQDRGPAPVVQQRHAQHDRDQVEEAVVAGGRDERLEGEEPDERDLPRATRGEHEEGQPQLDHEHHGAGEGLERAWEMARVPGEGRGQRLRPVVIAEGAQVVPGRVAPRELREAGAEHQLEQEQAEQPDDDGGRSGLVARAARADVCPRREEQAEEPGLGEEHVPLEGQEVLSEVDEGEVEGPADGEERSLGEAQKGQQRRRRPTVAENRQRGVARAQPAQRGQQPERLRPARLARREQQLPGGQEAMLADQAVDLRPERQERREVRERQQPQEDEARQPEARRAHEVADQEVDESRGQGAVGGHQAVAPLGQPGEPGQPAVAGERQREAPVGEGAIDRLGTPADAAVGLYEVNGLAESLHRDGGETQVGRLVRLEGQALATPRTQVLHAASAETAVAVPDEARAIQGADCSTEEPGLATTRPRPDARSADQALAGRGAVITGSERQDSRLRHCRRARRARAPVRPAEARHPRSSRSGSVRVCRPGGGRRAG